MRAFFCAAVAAALTFGASGPARSQTLSDPLTADAAVREALAANRDLQAARFSIDVARGNLLQAGRLENPEVELGYADDFAFNSEGERVGSLGFAQSFPVTARLARERDVARKDVAIAEAEVRDFVRILVAEVQSVFYSVRALNEQLGVNRQLVASVRDVERATARRVKAAEASPAEVSLLRIERLRLEQDAQRHGERQKMPCLWFGQARRCAFSFCPMAKTRTAWLGKSARKNSINKSIRRLRWKIFSSTSYPGVSTLLPSKAELV